MKLEQMKIKELLDTSHTIAEKLFEGAMSIHGKFSQHHGHLSMN